jgi:S1-C subfamily serine protease
MNKFKFAAILAAGAALALSPAHVAAQGGPPLQLKLVPEGAEVAKIVHEASAAELGLKLGDVVVEVGGKPMTAETFMDYMQSKKAGDPVTFKVKRAGALVDVTGKAPPEG